jgi:hypothetical protein
VCVQDIRESQLQGPVVVRQTGPRLKTLSQGGAVSFGPPSPSRSVTGQLCTVWFAFLALAVSRRLSAFGPSALGPSAFGPVSFGTVSFGTVSFGTVSFGTVSFGTVSFGTVSFGTVSFRTVSFGTVNFKTVSFGIVSFGIFNFGIVSFGTDSFGIVSLGFVCLGQQLWTILAQQQLAGQLWIVSIGSSLVRCSHTMYRCGHVVTWTGRYAFYIGKCVAVITPLRRSTILMFSIKACRCLVPYPDRPIPD